MSSLRLIHLTTLEQLRGAAAAWDDLWRRSDSASPLARAEFVAQWIERFAPREPFHALIVAENGVWRAALPLVRRRLVRLFAVAALPVNDWSPGGELLLDGDRRAAEVVAELAGALRRLPWSTGCFDQVRLDLPTWRHFAEGVAAQLPVSLQVTHQAGRVAIDPDWPRWLARCSASFRRNTRRLARRLSDTGEVACELHTQLVSDEVESHLRRGFEVEHRNWKGAAASSVLASGYFPFFLQQARQLAADGQLRLAFLTHGGRPIAFLYAAAAKGILHTYKIGYDFEFARYNPGHLLYYFLFPQLCADAAYDAVDFSGLLTSAQQHWRPTPYRVGRAVVATHGAAGRLAVYGHEHWWPRLRSIRRRWRRTPSPPLLDELRSPREIAAIE